MTDLTRIQTNTKILDLTVKYLNDDLKLSKDDMLRLMADLLTNVFHNCKMYCENEDYIESLLCELFTIQDRLCSLIQGSVLELNLDPDDHLEAFINECRKYTKNQVKGDEWWDK
jgi:chromosome condensin MukBEF complex kleisin-like MukF subunit